MKKNFIKSLGQLTARGGGKALADASSNYDSFLRALIYALDFVTRFSSFLYQFMSYKNSFFLADILIGVYSFIHSLLLLEIIDKILFNNILYVINCHMIVKNER